MALTIPDIFSEFSEAQINTFLNRNKASLLAIRSATIAPADKAAIAQDWIDHGGSAFVGGALGLAWKHGCTVEQAQAIIDGLNDLLDQKIAGE